MKKEYYVIIDGEKIVVTEEVYRAYRQPQWREKRESRMYGVVVMVRACVAKVIAATVIYQDSVSVHQGAIYPLNAVFLPIERRKTAQKNLAYHQVCSDTGRSAYTRSSERTSRKAVGYKK